MDALIQATSSPYLLVSFSDEGFIPRCEMIRLLAKAGDVHIWTTEYARYVGARIGIHNPSGDKVGTIGKLRNREHLFLCARQPLTKLERRILHAQDGWEFDVHRCIPSEETV
jgi:adenine-specific DNA-methyltransferase